MLAQIVDDVTREDRETRGSDSRWSQELALFKDAILQQQIELERTPSELQVRASWNRWKRERHLDIAAESGVDTSKLYLKKRT